MSLNIEDVMIKSVVVVVVVLCLRLHVSLVITIQDDSEFSSVSLYLLHFENGVHLFAKDLVCWGLRFWFDVFQSRTQRETSFNLIL